MSTLTTPPRSGAAPRAPDPSPPPPASASASAPAPAQPRRPWVRPAVVVAVIVALSGVGWHRYEGTAPAGPAELVLSGNIDVRQVNLSFKVGGRIDRLLVDEGDAVKAGQPLAALDVKYFEDDLRLARAQRDQAAANHERLKNGFRSEEVEQARALEREREATLKRAEQDLARYERTVTAGAGSYQDLDNARAAAKEAAAKLQSAAAARKLYEAGSRAEDVAQARAQLEAADAQVVEAERKLADSTLYAPGGGVVLTRAREAGAVVNPGETVFALTLTSPVWVRTYAGEPDLGAVRPGMAVAVTTDAPGGRAYAGHVGFVSPTAEFTPKTVETRELRTALVYRLRVVVDDPDGGLRQGMPVTVTVPLPGPRPRTVKERLIEALWLDRAGLVPPEGR